MATSVTISNVRTRWPHLASTTTISDALLTILLAEADSALSTVSLGTRREEAVTHYAAHKATVTVQASQTSGLNSGSVDSENFMHRSTSRGSSTGSGASVSGWQADLARTMPGQALWTLLLGVRRLPRVVG